MIKVYKGFILGRRFTPLEISIIFTEMFREQIIKVNFYRQSKYENGSLQTI